MTNQSPKLDRRVRIARPEDLEFILDLGRKNTEALGFLPRQAIEQYLNWRTITIAQENDESAGYLLCKHRQPDIPGVTQIHQACISYDARRRELGLVLVRRVLQNAAVAGNAITQLWCRGDLEANAFWYAAGFEAIALREGGRRRGIPHILWRHANTRHAELLTPPSSRRRNEPGKPLLRPSEISTRDIIEAARKGKLEHLLKSWSTPAVEFQLTNEPASPGRKLPTPAADNAPPPPGRTVPAQHTPTPTLLSQLTFLERRALAGRLRVPAGRAA